MSTGSPDRFSLRADCLAELVDAAVIACSPYSDRAEADRAGWPVSPEDLVVAYTSDRALRSLPPAELLAWFVYSLSTRGCWDGPPEFGAKGILAHASNGPIADGYLLLQVCVDGGSPVVGAPLDPAVLLGAAPDDFRTAVERIGRVSNAILDAASELLGAARAASGVAPGPFPGVKSVPAARSDSARNPAWTEDELVLALDLYVRSPHARQAKRDPDVAELSRLLRASPVTRSAPDPQRFRNVNGVFMKLQNFKAVDPDYTSTGRRGLQAGAAQRERELFERFTGREYELHELAQCIRERLVGATGPARGGASWVFQANPKVWDLRAALPEMDGFQWLVKQYRGRIAPGDTVYLWESGPQGGVLAQARVVSGPAPMPEDDAARRFKLNRGMFEGVQLRVELEVVKVLLRPIARAELVAHPDLGSMAILQRPQGTNFPLTPSEADALRAMAGAVPGTDTALPQRDLSPPRGGGR